MERVSDLSTLTIPKQTQAIDVNETLVAFREHYNVDVQCSNNIDTAMQSRVFSFMISPSIGSEVDLSKCYIMVSATVKKNGNPYNKASDQISCVQGLGLLMFE